MCKKEQCPNFDKCKCGDKVGTPRQVLAGVNTVLGIDHEIKSDNNRYENLTWIPMTTSPHHIRNRIVNEEHLEDDKGSFGVNALGVFNVDDLEIGGYNE